MILDSVSCSWLQYLDDLEQHIVFAAYPAEVTWSHLKARRGFPPHARAWLWHSTIRRIRCVPPSSTW